MVTIRIVNNGRCPVYAALLGFTQEKFRDITGASNDFWQTSDPNVGVTKFRQPFYRMNQGATTATGGMGLTVFSDNTNWFGSTAGPTTSDFVFFDGKFVDGKTTGSNFTEFFRLPVINDPILGCTEMPSSSITHFALDVAHLTDTATGTISSSQFPGAFDGTTYAGCTSVGLANVTVTIRFGEYNLEESQKDFRIENSRLKVQN